MQYGEFIALRTGLSSSEGDEPPKTRRFAKRSRAGCITCRRRHLRCDEIKPACERCTKAQVTCTYTISLPVSRVSITPSPPQSPCSMYGASQEYMDLQFWLEVGAENLGRWHSSAFHEQLLPQFSQAHSSARYALLALSTCVRQWHLPDAYARRKAAARGNRYYSMACEQLLASGTSKASIEAALVTSLTLFSYDTFSDRIERRQVHSNAAISLLKQMKQGLEYDELSGRRLETGKDGAQTVIETVDSWFNEISFPTVDEHPDQFDEDFDDSQISRTKLYVPIWLELDYHSGALSGDSTPLKPDPVQSPYQNWKNIHISPTNVQECHNYLTAWHSWLLTWVINTPMSVEELQVNQSLCRQWHTWLFGSMRPSTTMMLSMQNRALLLDEMFEIKILELSGNDDISATRPHLDRVVRIISSNIRISEQIAKSFDGSTSPAVRDYWTRQYLRGWPKVIEYLYRRLDDLEMKEQIFALFRLSLGDEKRMDMGKNFVTCEA